MRKSTVIMVFRGVSWFFIVPVSRPDAEWRDYTPGLRVCQRSDRAEKGFTLLRQTGPTAVVREWRLGADRVGLLADQVRSVLCLILARTTRRTAVLYCARHVGPPPFTVPGCETPMH